MKNREKYRDEIVEVIKEDNVTNEKMCCFAKDNIIPRFVSEEVMERSVCGGMTCHTCSKLFALWLDEEYEEPPKPEVDWSKVPVDTLVRVRDREDDPWKIQYFKGFDEVNNSVYKYSVWDNGRTSRTAEGLSMRWKYCELVEDEDENSSI